MNGRFSNKLTTALVAAAALISVTVYPVAASTPQTSFLNDQVVNVSVNFSSQIPLPDLTEETIAAKQKSGRMFLYEMARDECAVMKEVIAESCRLTSLNVNAQIRQQNNNNPPMLNINGSARFAITVKESVTP